MRLAVKDTIEKHLFGSRKMTQRQKLVFYGVSSMYLSMYGCWLTSGRDMPIEDLLKIVQSITWHGTFIP